MNLLTSIVSLDLWVQNLVFNLRTDFLDNFFLFFTNLGNWPVITFLFICFSILFYVYKKKDYILPFLVAVAGSGFMTVVVKYLVDRTRPGENIALYTEKGASFPSAHSALIFALFGFLIYCVWKFRLNIISKIILSIIFASIIILIGFSRLYLGVHFVSDVDAGYLVGLLWVLIAMYVSGRSFSFLRHNRS